MFYAEAQIQIFGDLADFSRFSIFFLRVIFINLHPVSAKKFLISCGVSLGITAAGISSNRTKRVNLLS